jgi:hypothetical protein
MAGFPGRGTDMTGPKFTEGMCLSAVRSCQGIKKGTAGAVPFPAQLRDYFVRSIFLVSMKLPAVIR